MSESHEECVKRWEAASRSALVGRKIVNTRYMTDAECSLLGWRNKCVVIELDDGTKIFPSMDDEGNGSGSLLGPVPKDARISRDDWDDHPMLPVIEKGPSALEKIFGDAFDRIEAHIEAGTNSEEAWDDFIKEMGISETPMDGWPCVDDHYYIPPNLAAKALVLGFFPETTHP